MRIRWGRSIRLGWHKHLLGPFGIGGTIARVTFGPRRTVYHGKLPDGWRCPHDHERQDTADACRDRELRRRTRQR
jgi:hypothetical protein